MSNVPSGARWRNKLAHQFSNAPQAMIGRSSFSRSHGYKTTFNASIILIKSARFSTLMVYSQ